MLTHNCKKCEWTGVPVLEESGPHMKATCPECNTYIKFVSKKEAKEIFEHHLKEEV